MTSFTCDDCGDRSVDVGDANPSLVICASCNGGNVVYNDIGDEGWEAE